MKRSCRLLETDNDKGKQLKTKAGNIKRSKHGLVSTYNNSKYERNVLVNFDILLDFCVSNMVYKRCRLVLDRESFQLESAGLAVDVSYDCKGCQKHALAKNKIATKP
jgi:hypothetical protein